MGKSTGSGEEPVTTAQGGVVGVTYGVKRMKMIKGLLAGACLTGLVATAPASAATQIVNSSGVLTGATGVLISGVSYDVAFLDGTCASVFGACTVSNFAFKTQANAILAARALLDQVFVNTDLGMFDSNPALTNGCADTVLCRTNIPYALTAVSTVTIVAQNNGGNSFDFDNPNELVGKDSSTLPLDTFARFALSPVVAAVPEPATWAMMIAGFGLVGGAMRRRKITVATRIRFA
ncbi:PEPxxWA-CTERM sorting domain-containing protein [Sphingomonas sp. PAMC 26621]|uniref:PEPxxWA-CTERM sorting domain-containing protein n=1 Tax=Sphingomonas sp. PAMC 26621 TaxID=1112213 RepID=UPI001EE68758|nr:PEPxxWA-CTERM sorting domain-containing protein [Sphingomonas sp. PAMC 26621]